MVEEPSWLNVVTNAGMISVIQSYTITSTPFFYKILNSHEKIIMSF